MNAILILTDFSENASQAARAATLLIEKLHSDVVLYHTYYDSPEFLSYAGGTLLVDELALRKEDAIVKLDQLATTLRADIKHLSHGAFCPAIKYQCSEGPLRKNVSAILNKRDVELIVMGCPSGTDLSHLLFGSDTLSVMDAASRPVLVIPPKFDFGATKKITLATNFEPADIDAIAYLTRLCKNLGYELNVVHVNVYGENEDPSEKLAIQTFLDNQCISYNEIRGKNVMNRLGTLCEESRSDILAIIHYDNGFFSNIFRKSNTAQVVLNHPIPLLIIPGKLT